MTQRAKLRLKRKEILQELACLEEFRRGSVVEQLVESLRRDGSRAQRGPYRLYSFKEKGKTLSRRLKDEQEAAKYRREIHAFRRFHTLVAELISLGEQLSDLPQISQEGEKKRRMGTSN